MAGPIASFKGISSICQVLVVFLMKAVVRMSIFSCEKGHK